MGSSGRKESAERGCVAGSQCLREGCDRERLHYRQQIHLGLGRRQRRMGRGGRWRRPVQNAGHQRGYRLGHRRRDRGLAQGIDRELNRQQVQNEETKVWNERRWKRGAEERRQCQLTRGEQSNESFCLRGPLSLFVQLLSSRLYQRRFSFPSQRHFSRSFERYFLCFSRPLRASYRISSSDVAPTTRTCQSRT